MDHWCIALVAVVAAALILYVLAPGMYLRVGLLLYPKGHEKRAEFLGELHYVPYWRRLRWVAGQFLHCVLEGPAARKRAWTARNRIDMLISNHSKQVQLPPVFEAAPEAVKTALVEISVTAYQLDQIAGKGRFKDGRPALEARMIEASYVVHAWNLSQKR